MNTPNMFAQYCCCCPELASLWASIDAISLQEILPTWDLWYAPLHKKLLTRLQTPFATWSQPRREMEWKSILGLRNVYWQLVWNFARITAPSVSKLKNVEPKQLDNLSAEKMDALATLQLNLISAPMLALPRSEGYLSLYAGRHWRKWQTNWWHADTESPGWSQEPVRVLVPST